MFVLELRCESPRRQGDIGEMSAADWPTRNGFCVWLPAGRSPDIDLIAQRNGRLLRVQVKTSTAIRNGRFAVSLSTKGGNQSWTGSVKTLDPARYDYLFVLVGDGRGWFIPSHDVSGRTMILLGGPKYASFEVDSPLCSD